MSRRDRTLDPSEWLRFERSDLVFARLEMQPGMLFEMAGFHAQQAAEKAIKAVIVQITGEAPPRTHDIGYLLLHVPPPMRVGRPDEVAQLTRYAVTARYPDDIEEMDEFERDAAVALAERVVAWAEGVIGNLPDAA